MSYFLLFVSYFICFNKTFCHKRFSMQNVSNSCVFQGVLFAVTRMGLLINMGQAWVHATRNSVP